MTSMRVLIVSHTYIAPINRAKLKALAQHVTLDVIIPNRWHDDLFDLQARDSESADYTLHQLPIRLSGHILRYFYSLKALNHIIHESQPDLLYIEEEPPSLVLAQLASLKFRHRFKLTFFSWENLKRRAGLPGIRSYNLRRCDGAIAGNNEAAHIIKRSSFRGSIQTTPQLGVDPDMFRPTPSVELRQKLGLKRFVVGYIGRLIEQKGLRTLLEAASELPDVQLLLVGKGAFRDEIGMFARRHSIQHRIHIVDAIPHEQIVTYLNALDVLILPSQTMPIWKEQFGHILIEAMSCGVPVIGSNSGAIPEVIGDAGLIFKEGDSLSLREALQRYATDSDLRRRMGRVGRERVLNHYTHQQIAAAHVEFFSRVLET